MVSFIIEQQGVHSVEAICRQLPIAPSTYYEHAARRRDASRLPERSRRDARLLVLIKAAWEGSEERYGVRKVWRELQRGGVVVARCTVERLMRQANMRGVSRGGHKVFTTVPDDNLAKPADLVERDFKPDGPNRLWVADVTFVKTMIGFAYVAFVIDAFSKRIVGWNVARSLRSSLVLVALDQALHERDHGHDLTHHSDHGSQYLSIAYTQKLMEAGIAASVGSKGDAYDNAQAETINGLYKAEVIHHQGPWHHPMDVEIATARWVHWYNHKRLYEALGYISPAEFEEAYYRQGQAAA